MSDLKSFWPNPVGPDASSLTGSGVTDSGTDPQVTIDTPNALQPIWTTAPVPAIDGQESANSVSGLPPLPNRYEPPDEPPPPPTLQDRRPGTVDLP